jgi:hypothetical protein
MPSCKTYCLIKMITLWSFLNELQNNIYNKILNIYMYFKNYYSGNHDTWLFIPGHTYPLVKSNIYNNIDTIWVYDNFKNKLQLNIDSTHDTTSYKFAWLSANIKITHSSSSNDESPLISKYDIDNFIEYFSIQTTDDLAPNLYTIFLSWCAHTKHWFKISDTVEFNVIDENGEDQCFNILNHNNALVFSNNKITIRTNISEDSLNSPNNDNQVIENDIFLDETTKEE